MITVLGSTGFIGSHVVRYLQDNGLTYQAPARDEPLHGRELGHVIYCIGMTADFREKPLETVEAHVCKLLDVVRHCAFESILYLSSARLYLPFDDLYNHSKKTGESLVLSLGERGRVARLSLVYGPGQRDTFLAMVLEEAETRGRITLRSAPESSRDYIHVDDVAPLLVSIALRGRQRMYNVVSGIPVTHAAVTAAIAERTGCAVDVLPNAPVSNVPEIDNESIRSEFGFTPRSVLDDLRRA